MANHSFQIADQTREKNSLTIHPLQFDTRSHDVKAAALKFALKILAAFYIVLAKNTTMNMAGLIHNDQKKSLETPQVDRTDWCACSKTEAGFSKLGFYPTFKIFKRLALAR